jgi:acyl carrier protein
VINLAAAVLGHTDVSGSTNFFAAGGHSLAAIDLCTRLSKALGREISVSTAFDAATLDDIAAQVDAELADAGARFPLPAVGGRRADCRASFAQRRLLAASRGVDGVPAPVVPLPFQLSAPVDVEALLAALDGLVARHPVLTTRFHRDERGELRVRAVENTPALDIIDLTPIPAAQRDDVMRGYCRELMAAARDLEAEPPLRSALFLSPPHGGVLLLIVDHLAFDGRSLCILTRDLTHLYATGGKDLPGPGLSFLDYADWEAERERDGTIDRLAQAAVARLTQREPPLWPADKRLAACARKQAITTTVKVPAGTHEFRAFAQRLGVTVFAAVLATVTAAFAQAKPNSGLRIALQTSTRVDHRLFDAMGPFINTTYLDVPLDQPIEALARALQARILAAQADAIVPIDLLLHMLEINGQRAPAALADVFFSLHQDDAEVDPRVARRITPLDPQEGWDPEDFALGYAVAILATLTADSLALRFGTHPAIHDPALHRTFAEAMADQAENVVARAPMPP